MNTFLDDKGQMSKEDVIKIASGCLQQEVEGITKIGEGRNSRVYKVICPSQEFVVKFYFQDSRDRLGIEFKSSSFLWEQGLRVIPKPVALSREYQCAFYEFIKGTPPARDVSQKDVDGAVYFLETLKDLTARAEDFNFSGASEAFFCGKDIVNGLRERLNRFPADDTHEYLALKQYLKEEFLPLLEAVEAWSKKYLTSQGVSWTGELSKNFRTLSPSDFGFHNALRTSAGTMVFLDFEYFGWDDPAKLVSDFLWHPNPAMNMSDDLKKYFVHRMSMIFGNDPYFNARLKGMYSLFGLKWCVILLNEFSPVDAQRRDFARPLAKNKTEIRLEQLAKAKRMSERIKTMYKDFPYGC